MSRDLPAFDSLWIDALVRHRALTPFQGRVLDAAAPEQLRAGPFLLVDRIEQDAWRGVYRARRIVAGEPGLVAIHPLHPDALPRAADRLSLALDRLHGLADSALAAPTSIDIDRDRILLRSRDVEGPSLKELLVRRGRFPPDAVLAIARQLLAALALLEHRGVAHGDVRLKNIRISADGRLNVLFPGVLPAIEPDLSLATRLPLDAFDGVAPELAAQPRAPTSASDQYAGGCVLWQLLAGRPPFPTGDPLAKLAAHRTRGIPDIRDIAPATPRELAEVIGIATRPDPAQREAGFERLLRRIGPPGARDERRLRRFLKSFQGEAPARTAEGPSLVRRLLPTAATIVVLGVLGVLLARTGFHTELLQIGGDPAPATAGAAKSGRRSAAAADTTQVSPTAPETAIAGVSATPDATRPSNDRVPSAEIRAAAGTAALPDPDPDGTLWLTPGATYLARDVHAGGTLIIRAPDSGLATIVVQGEPWQVAADSLRLENVSIRFERQPAPEPAVSIRARSLEIVRSRFDVVAPRFGDAAPVWIRWEPKDPASAVATSLTLQNVHFGPTGMHCPVRPGAVSLTNCLKTGGGPWLKLGAAGRPQRQLRVRIARSTLRESGPLIEWTPAARAAGMRIEVLANACVFDLAEGASLLRLDADASPPDWQRTLAIGGVESVLSPGASLVALSGLDAPLDESLLDADGLLSGEVVYRGRRFEDAADSELVSTTALRSTRMLPGISAAELPETPHSR
ncbi:MAG: protein kinase [Planctomyces sp.]|nr:protein kinase [Planctomyces sp.]